MRKGEQTRTLILNEAVALASQVGLEGLSIGSLAGRLDMSKSGLFAHFGSKEDLQVRTLRRAQELFLEQVVSPALKQAQGLPRLRNLFSNWLAWLESNDDLPGGCLMLAASVEYDDRPGAVRDLLVAGQRELRGAIAKAIRLAIDEGHLEPQTDPWQLTFELFGVVLAAHHDLRLLGDPRALERAGDALERLIEAHRAAELSVLRART
ncbi:MAG TPA: TetR/AcrR family transcriptional regulator [Burkholderiales bacterium]|jgi:AcrR family transcriptional regulator|nr:TetR/AcrR family transcriptional regulator [Burkholderiales bacterium]